MTKPATVIDKDGKQVVREDGVLLNGDIAHVPFMFADGKTKPGGIFIKDNVALVTSETLDHARRILGDEFVAADFAGLTNILAQHTVVRKRLGTVANGRPAQFLDAAWGALTGSRSNSAAAPAAVAPPVLTDGQKTFAADQVKRALADRTGSPASVQDSAAGAKAARNHQISDAWKSDGQRAEESILDGLSRSERLALTSGSPASYAKASDRKVSDAEFYERRRRYQAQRGNAA